MAMIPTEEMTPDSLDTIHCMAKPAYGEIDNIYLHWTAGRYGQAYDDYHICIDKGGEIYVMCDEFTERLNHTWHRNSYAMGIALCCGYDATCNADGTVNLGSEPPTMEQIESLAEVVAALSHDLELPLYNKEYIMTHCEAAEIDGYGPSTTCERWDLWKLPDYCGDGEMKDGGDLIRGKAAFYQRKWYE